MAVTSINSQEGLLNFRGFHGSKSSSLLQLSKWLHSFSCLLKCFSTFSIYQIDNIPCWNPKYVIHVGRAFRDTSLSNVWQLVASLRKKFGQPRPRPAVAAVRGQSPDFSKSFPNYSQLSTPRPGTLVANFFTVEFHLRNLLKSIIHWLSLLEEWSYCRQVREITNLSCWRGKRFFFRLCRWRLLVGCDDL